MGGITQYAVLQKDGLSPNADQIRRAFRSFNNLTDADAVRLAASAQGILLRHLQADAARAFQVALNAEGVSAALVPEDELCLLPEGKSLHRFELTPDGFITFDLLGRAKLTPWKELALIAAGAVRQVEMSRTQTERSVFRLFGVRPKAVSEAGTKLDSTSQLILELVLRSNRTRYQINAAQFPFKYTVDRPDLSPLEKFVWLVKEICRHAPGAVLNRGARDICDGTDLVRGYSNHQVFNDEMTWLLWHGAQKKT